MWHSSLPEGRGTRLEHPHTPEIMTPAVGLPGGRSGFESRQRHLEPVVSDWSLSLASFPLLQGDTGAARERFDDLGYRDNVQKCPARGLGPEVALSMGIESQPPTLCCDHSERGRGSPWT